MKKYLLGLLAIVLAVGFSSFSPSKNVRKANYDTEYNYWYNVVSDLVVDEFIQNETKSNILSSDPPCIDDGDVFCLVGSQTQLSANQDVTELTLAADAKIQHD